MAFTEITCLIYIIRLAKHFNVLLHKSQKLTVTQQILYHILFQYRKPIPNPGPKTVYRIHFLHIWKLHQLWSMSSDNRLNKQEHVLYIWSVFNSRQATDKTRWYFNTVLQNHHCLFCLYILSWYQMLSEAFNVTCEDLLNTLLLKSSRRMRQVDRGCLLLLCTWSHLWYILRSTFA
jgi:hypothetical protein